MLKDLHVAHLTGTATVVENNFFSDEVRWDRPRRTISQMFFKPYESKKEFVFCARHTFQPVILVGLAILDPMVMVNVPLVFTGITAGLLVLSGIQKCLGNDESAIWALNAANEIFSRLCQAIINILVLPITALAMLTRTVSTGLKAAELYDFDAPPAHRAKETEKDDDEDDALDTSGLTPSYS